MTLSDVAYLSNIDITGFRPSILPKQARAYRKLGRFIERFRGNKVAVFIKNGACFGV